MTENNSLTLREEQQLIQLLSGWKPSASYWLERNFITRIDKIDALELAGAIIIHRALIVQDEKYEITLLR